MKKSNIIMISAFLLLAIAYFGLSALNKKAEREIQYSVSDLKYDDTTYKYVKEKCDSGVFASDSDNCRKMREAR